MGFKVQITELSNLPALKNTTAVAISDYSGIGTKTTKVVVVQDTNIGTAAYQAAVQAAIEAKDAAAEAKAEVANTVKKTGDQVMAGSLTLPRVIANTGVELQDANGYGMRQVFSGPTGYLQAGKMDRTTTDQSLMLSGWYGTPLSMLRFSMAQGINPRVVWGSSSYDILHRGNMPTPTDIGAVASTDKAIWKYQGAFTDFNACTLPGHYQGGTNLVNGPAGFGIPVSYGHMTVSTSGLVPSNGVWFTQTYYTHTVPSRMFIRVVVNGDFTKPWLEFYSTGSKPSAADVGTLTTAEINTELAKKVNLTGDTMTGALTIARASNIALNIDSTNGTEAQIHFKHSGKQSWMFNKDANRDLNLWRYNEDGTGAFRAIKFFNDTSVVSFEKNPVTNAVQSVLENSLTRKDYVDALVADLENKKANLSYVNSSLVLKADKTYVDAELLKKADIAGQVFSGNVRVDRGTSTEPQIGVDRSGRRLFLFDNGTSHGLYSSGLGTGNANTNLITRDTTTGTLSIGGTVTESLNIISTNLSLTGNKIELGGVMRVEGYTTGDSRLSANRYAFMDGPSGSFLSTGEYYNGTAWVKHTASVPSMRFSLENESVMLFSSPANANPNTNSRPAARIYRDGRFGSSNETRRGWSAQGEASFYRERMAVDSGNLVGITSAQYNYPNQWGGEHYTGSYITPNFDETSYVIGYNNDAGASIHWLIRPNGVIQFSRSPGANDWITFLAPRMTVSGDVYANSFQHNSDLRLKSDVKPLENCLGKLSSIGAYSYIKNGFEGREVGVIAQEVNAVLPDAT